MPDKLNAIDVVDWEYLCKIANPHDLAYSTDPQRALEIFAFQLTHAEDAEHQNEVLRKLILRMTSGHTKETNRQVMVYLAGKCRANAQLLTEFAKQEGVLP